MNRKGFAALLCLILLCAACGGTEAKKSRFFTKGKALYEKGDYTRARLEFKNTLQVAPRFAEAYYMLGMVEFHENKWRDAFGHFSEAVKLDPRHLPAQLKLGQIFLAARDPDHAMEKAELVLKAAPGNEDALLLKGAAYLAKKDPDKAILCLEELKARGNRSPDLFMMAASVYLGRKDLKKAEDALRSGIGANPRSTMVHFALADFYLRANRRDDAVPVLRTLIRLEPDKAAHRLVLAGVLWDMGKVPEAIDILNGITAELKGDGGRIAVASFYLQRGKTEAAEEELKKGLREKENSFALRFALSDIYMNTSRSDEAIAMLKACLTLSKDLANPEVLKAKNALARIHLARHEVEEAERYVEEVLKDSPKDVEARFQKGIIHVLRGEGSQAVAEFRAVLNVNPGSVPALLRLAEAHVVNGEPKLAEDCLQSALKANPASVDVQRAIGRLYAARREFAAAEEYLSRLHEARPQDVGVTAELADAFLAARDLKRAEAGYREIERKAPRFPLGYEKMGRLYLALGKWGEAVPELRKALEIFPQSEEMNALLSEAYVRQRKHDAALALCDDRLKQDPKDASSWKLKGSLLTRLKDFPKAEDAFRRAVGLRPLWSGPQISLACLLLARGNHDEAAKVLENVTKTNPGNLTAGYFLGYAYYQRGEHRRGMDLYEKLLKGHPDFWKAANGLAFMLAEQAGGRADLDRALAMAQKVQKSHPLEPSVMDTMGWVLYKRGDVNQALEWIVKAQAGMPADPTINYHMGMVFFRAGKRREAKQFLGKALAPGEDFSGRQEARETIKRL